MGREQNLPYILRDGMDSIALAIRHMDIHCISQMVVRSNGMIDTGTHRLSHVLIQIIQS